MFGWDTLRHGTPLAHTADRASGSLRMEPQGDSVSVIIVEADGAGVTVEADQSCPLGQAVVGEYQVNDVSFVFQGKVSSSDQHCDGTWQWRIGFVLATR